MFYILYLPFLTLIILFYFRLAVQYNIIDRPNYRSSHKRITIRGGGIIFPISLLILFLTDGFDYPLFTSGLVLISLFSFYDDLQPLSNKIRLLSHLSAVSLLFIQVGLMAQSFWVVCIGYILVIGTINAYNFMDGINGITGAYCFVTLISLYIINESSRFVLSEWILVSVLAILVFNYFNFRKKAKCFAGDVGSVSIAFIIIFFILQLIIKTGDLKYIGLLLVYGLDSITTIVFRLIRKENIFQAHRSHFYQYMVNVRGWSHLKMSALYMLTQTVINVLIIYADLKFPQFAFFIFVLGIIFVAIRFIVEGKTLLTPITNKEV